MLCCVVLHCIALYCIQYSINSELTYKCKFRLDSLPGISTDRNSNNSSNNNNGTYTCSACPSGAQCVTTGLGLADVPSEQGFFRMTAAESAWFPVGVVLMVWW